MKHVPGMLCATILALTTTTDASNTSHWSSPKMYVVLRSSDKPKQIDANEIKLDEPRAVRCRSRLGCLISIQAQVFTPDDHGAYLCGLVDGVEAQICQKDLECCTTHMLLQNARLAQGAHTVQTVLRADGTGGTVAYWTVNYTIYEK